MNYIYDILVNFQNEFYENFQWNIDDNITHIMKIPLFKVQTKDLLKFCNNKVRFSKEFLNKIYNKTEIFMNKKILQINYACLLTDGNEVIAVKIKQDGLLKYGSKLLIDENEEVLEYSSSMNTIDICYETLEEVKKQTFRTRKEQEILTFINEQLDKIQLKNESDKIEYLYYECFGKKGIDSKEAVIKLKNALNDEFSSIFLQIYHFFMMTISK